MADPTEINLKQERNRFIIAIVIISGFLIILLYSLFLKSETSSPEILAGIFGGWIAAVLSFYFGQQNLDSANRHTISALNELSANRSAVEIGITNIQGELDALLNLAKTRTQKDITIQELDECKLKIQNEIIKMVKR